jgi:serine/threonine-protein kinase
MAAIETFSPVKEGTLPKKLFGYDVIDFIGEGARSVIYVVSEPATRQIYALKHVVRKEDRDQRFIDQLENEFEVARQLNHPGLRRAVDMKANRTLLRKVTDAALVMELFDGAPLDVDLPPKLTDLVDCFIKTAQALDALHKAGFVHCDLKPNNILRNHHGDVKVIDLGQACKIGTVKERIQGTPDYISPEQVKLEPVTNRTDVFNFGATMYWSLTGKKLPTLFTLKKGNNSFLLDAAIASPRDLNPLLPENLSNIVMECVRTNPLKRPGDIGELSRRLEIVLHGLKSAARRPGLARAS